jgi:hypothetical protein
LEGDIPCYDFETHWKMTDFIDSVCYGRKRECVWLIAKEGSNDVFISESYINIQIFLNKMPLFNTVGNYFLQEYSSYEEAYKVALMINETSPLCYEPE